MVATESTMSPLGTKAADFCLPDTQGRMVSLEQFKDAPALLVIFMCNHCPFVKYIRDDLARLAKQYQGQGVAVVGINSNDVEKVPADGPEMMAQEVKSAGYTFPYLYDKNQEVAKAYHAACTPDFFLFDKDRKLVYRGQMDDSRPNGTTPITGADLTAAIQALLQGRQVSQQQIPSMGCNIKWKPGNQPEYVMA